VRGAVVAIARRGHRKRSGGIRSRAVRVAAAALALSGTGLMVTGVANAVTAPALAPGKVIDGPQVGSGGLALPSLPLLTVSDSASASTAGGDSSSPSAAAGGSPSTGAAPGASRSASAPAAPVVPSTVPSGGVAPSGAASGSASGAVPAPQPSATMSQPAARQVLAETGADRSIPWLFSGGVTLFAGGLVFRFGPRTAPRHAG
jgi:hypothetical protein